MNSNRVMSMAALPILHHRSTRIKDRGYSNLEDNVIVKRSPGHKHHHAIELKLESMVKSTTKALARHTPRLDDVEPISKASLKKTCRGKSSAAKDALQLGRLRLANNNRSVSSSSRSVSRAQINLDAPELPVSKLGGLPRVAIGLSEPIASSDLATKVPAIRNNDDCSLALNSSDARKLRAKPERQKKAISTLRWQRSRDVKRRYL
ncbi:hypothetical protein MHU86_24013 [Fragilaria crotonensis]|nr:hypothetical protein MHU86_24013 [Fragilaria crotonensis]